MMRNLKGKVAIVTGASSGIGRAIALALAAEGAQVALVARRQDLLAATAEAARRLGGAALVAPADVADRSQVEAAVAQAVAHFGRLDVVVACAGIYVRGPIETLTAADFERSMQVNFFGTLYLVLAALPHLRAQRRGHIVIISSMDGKKAIPPDAPYVAAKFAQAGLGDDLRQQLYGSGIDVTTVFPGRVATPLIDGLEVPRISAPIPPESVASAVIAAIKRRRPEVVLPFGSRLLLFINGLSPRLGDWAVRVLRLGGCEKKP